MTQMKSAAAEGDRLFEEPTPENEVLADVVERVQVDAQDEPDTYLTETIVPGGGE
jgi:hypothetical protein